MARLLFFMLAVALAALLWRNFLGGTRGGGAPRPPGAPSAPPPADAPASPPSETMVRCEQCGVNVPQSEAVFERGRWYCCREHLPPRPGGA